MPNWNISFKLLHCFTVLVQTQSYTKTAEKLGITQPTVTKAIQQIEKNLEIQLFNQFELTEIGECVYQHALQLLSQQQKLKQDIARYQNTQLGTLKLGVPPLGAQLLTTPLFEFHRQCPEITFSFLEVGSKGIKNALIQNQLDVGVLLAPIETEIFHSIELCNYPLMVVLRRDAIWANRQTIALSELSNQSFLMFQENFSLNEVILTACQQAGFEPTITCRSSQWGLLADMVYQRMGVALLPKYYTDMLDPQRFTAVQLVDPTLKWHLVMAWKKNSYISPALQQWLRVMQNYRFKD